MTEFPEPGAAEPSDRDAEAAWAGGLPFTGLVLALALVFAVGAESWLTVSSFIVHEARIMIWLESAPLAVAAGYVALCLICAAISIPAGAFLGVVGGELFGAVLGPVLFLAGTTGGAVILFLSARPPLRRIALSKGGEGGQRALLFLNRHAALMAMALRLPPIVPGPVPALALAASGASTAAYTAGTVLGLIPTAVLFGCAGAGRAESLVVSAGEGFAVVWQASLALAVLAAAIIGWAVTVRRRLL